MENKKHILVISQYFYPESFRINDICSEWVKRGYKVTVLTGIPNYPEGKFYNGYNCFKKRKENRNGIDIIRVPIISRGKSPVRLVLNYYSYVVSGFFWSLFTRLKADMVFTFAVSPMTQAKIGVWYSKRRKIPSYLYVQDLWPDNLEIVGGIHNKHVLNHYSRLSKKMYHNSAKVLATSQSFVDEIKSRMDKNRERVMYWPQYAEETYKPVERKPVLNIPNDDRFKIVFTGNIGYAQGLGLLPKTAEKLKNGGVNDVCFVIVGDGRYKEQLLKEISDLKVSDMFCFVERQPVENIPAILAACDVAYVSFMNSPLFEKTIPAKLQSYMACGKPVLASASGETKRIVEEAQCGICADIGDVSKLIEAIENIKKADIVTMGENSRKYYLECFEKNILMDELDKQIKSDLL